MKRCFEWLRSITLMVAMVWTANGVAQEAANRPESPSPGPSNESVSGSVRELREPLRELQAAVAGMRADWQRARAETTELRQELDQIRANQVRTGTGPRNAVMRDAPVIPEAANSEAAAGSSQDSSQSVLQNGAPQDEKPDQKEDQKKSEHAASLEEDVPGRTCCFPLSIGA
jgi:TolA-binding protein